jgi:hypothetical protein
MRRLPVGDLQPITSARAATSGGVWHLFRLSPRPVRLKTLDEIGKVYGVTRERIRQIESKTMSKLRHPSRSKVLRDYLD